MRGYGIESPISCDWDHCKVSMRSLRSEGEDAEDIIEVLGLGAEASA